MGDVQKFIESRFIPAGAGNTQNQLHQIRQHPVYPRWRGEHAVRSTYTRSARRFIPAGAGNTLNSGYKESRHTVYPRWRGEHRVKTNVAKTICGLSPLARGTLHLIKKEPIPVRFIPAGAGNTLNLYICSRKPFLPPNNPPTLR